MSPDPLTPALAALLQPTPATILATEAAIEASGWPPQLATVVPDRALPTALREHDPAVVLVHRVTMTLVRALRNESIALLVLTADAAASRLDALAPVVEPLGIATIGPRAKLRHDPEGTVLCCAAEPGELEGLWRALGGAALAVSPTPAWWWKLLAHPDAKDRPAAGYVPAEVLDEHWARWATAQGPQHVLVPLGVPFPVVDEPADPSLAPAAAAHALERFTGPVFPSPRVIGSVLKGLRGTATAASGEPPDPGIWQQARRALPLTGALVGMEQARSNLAADVATAAFLAQRALLRADSHAPTAPKKSRRVAAPAIDEEGIDRATEVLSSAGQILTDHESKVVLRGFGIEVTRQAVASSASGAAGFADRIGFPVALKALSPDLRRRSEIGAMALDLPTAAAVRRAYATIVDVMERDAPTARLDGVLVAEMVDPGLDLHCGAIRLPQGGLALFGRCADQPAPIEPVLALCPVSPDAALLLAHAILARMPVPALRRRSDPNPRVLAELLLRLDAMVERFADRLELVELRPVRLLDAEGDRSYATLDARIVQQPHLQGT